MAIIVHRVSVRTNRQQRAVITYYWREPPHRYVNEDLLRKTLSSTRVGLRKRDTPTRESLILERVP